MKGRGLGSSGELDSLDMAGLKAGDHPALERLYERYAKRVTGFFWRLGKRNGEIDDLVHEVFVRLWRHGRGWRGEGRLSTYLFGIARSVWLDSRSRTRREFSMEDFPRSAGSAGPDLEMERRELGQRIEAAVAELAEPLRLVFSMATAGGLKYREIAELLAIPIGTVKSRMAAAQEKLRASLAGYLGVKQE